MPKCVISFEFDLPGASPLLSTNAGVAQNALADVEEAIGEAVSTCVGTHVPTIAVWPQRGAHVRTIVRTD